MNTKLFFSCVVAIMLTTNAFSQKDSTSDSDKKIIKKERKVIVIDGDNITINGKPVDPMNAKDLEELKALKGFKDNFSMMGPEGRIMMMQSNDNKAFLGVLTEKNEKGARITELTKGSAAEKAGLNKGDIITKVNDTKIEDGNGLREAIGKFKPEEKVTISFLRDGKESTVTAVLGKNKPQEIALNKNFNFNFPKNFPGNNFKDFNFWNASRKPRLGLQIQDMEEGNGVKIIDVNEKSPAEKAGLKKDDIIVEMDGKEIKDVEDLRTKLSDIKEGDTYKIKYKRGGKSQTVDIKIPKQLKTADL